MRAVVQRVLSASVDVVIPESRSLERVAAIGPGFMVLVGIRNDDTETDSVYLAQKIASMRIVEDLEGRINLSLADSGGAALIVSNFTLYADCRKGRRPSFSDAASGEAAVNLYRRFGDEIEKTGIPTQYGRFGAEMQVSLVNDGPITVLLDSRKQF